MSADGRFTVNTDPRPGSLAALTAPPCASTIAFERYSPSPVPGRLRSPLAARKNLSKTKGKSFAGIPAPVSITRAITFFLANG